MRSGGGLVKWDRGGSVKCDRGEAWLNGIGGARLNGIGGGSVKWDGGGQKSLRCVLSVQDSCRKWDEKRKFCLSGPKCYDGYSI